MYDKCGNLRIEIYDNKRQLFEQHQKWQGDYLQSTMHSYMDISLSNFFNTQLEKDEQLSQQQQKWQEDHCQTMHFYVDTNLDSMRYYVVEQNKNTLQKFFEWQSNMEAIISCTQQDVPIGRDPIPDDQPKDTSTSL